MYKKEWCTCKVDVLRNKPIAFLTSSLPSPSLLLKLPILRGASRVPAPRTSAYLGRKFLSHFSQISVGEHVQIIAEPIGAKLLFSEKPIIRCFKTGHPVGIKFLVSLLNIFMYAKLFQILASCIWPKHPKKSWEITVFFVVVL